eukprot:GHUV01050382.1.p2 GENE.GHUV01050382.1~~GHUV01050382.1.p2  ORF type:complete len:100 (-),score=5.91 GHUV01050382.1:948-1247(-)
MQQLSGAPPASTCLWTSLCNIRCACKPAATGYPRLTSELPRRLLATSAHRADGEPDAECTQVVKVVKRPAGAASDAAPAVAGQTLGRSLLTVQLKHSCL